MKKKTIHANLELGKPIEDMLSKNDPTTVLARNDLYDTLDFRINSLRIEYADLVHEIMEQGSSTFAMKVS